VSRLLTRWLALPWWARLLLFLPGLALLAVALTRREHRDRLSRVAFDWADEADAAADAIDEEQLDEEARQERADAKIEEAGKVARARVEGVRWDGEGPFLDDGEWGSEKGIPSDERGSK